MRNNKGFTLVELLVVMIILGLLAGLVLPQYFGVEEKSKVKIARTQIALLSTALESFRSDVGRYPTTEEGLDALVRKPGSVDNWTEPYLTKNVPLDPWGKAYVYRSPGDHGRFDLLSYGADGLVGGEGNNHDIANWEK